MGQIGWLMLLFLVCSLLLSATAQVGPTGPKGDKGDTGLDGQSASTSDGDPGIDGIPGDPVGLMFCVLEMLFWSSCTFLVLFSSASFHVN